MWIFWVAGAGVVALVAYMAAQDLKARRRRQRLSVSDHDAHNARLAAQAEFDKHNPGVAGHVNDGGFSGGRSADRSADGRAHATSS